MITPRSLRLAAILLVAPASFLGPGAIASPGAAGPSVVAGAATRIERFPSTVRVISSTGLCGGTLIAPTKVATAQHCVTGAAASSITVYLGRTAWSTDRVGEAIGVSSVRLMPGYSFPKNDAAVLTLTRASLAPTARLATSSSPFITKGDTATVVGWGRTVDGGDQQDSLRQGSLTLRGDPACNYTGYDNASNLCAGDAAGDAASCQGDSGGPLYTTGTDGRLELLGVVSGGALSGCTDGPNFFADAATGPVHTFLAADAAYAAPQFAAYGRNVVVYDVAGGVRTIRIDQPSSQTILASGGEVQSAHAVVADGSRILLHDTTGDGQQVFAEDLVTHQTAPSFSATSPGSVGYAGQNAAYTYAPSSGSREFSVFGTSFSAPALLGVVAPTRATRVAYGARTGGADRVSVQEIGTGLNTSFPLPAGWTVTDVAFQSDLKVIISMRNKAAGNGEAYECTPALTTVVGQSQPLSSCTAVLQTGKAARIATFESGSQALLAYTQGARLLLLDRNTGSSRQLASNLIPGAAIAAGPSLS